VLFSVSGGDDLTMYEINEAAKVITDSIHPEAKVIFGAVNDPTLKKGELKVTVIATGFAEVEPVLREAENTDKNKGGIVQSAKQGQSGAGNNSDQNQNIQNIQKPKEEEDEDWDIPAFIRKKMK